MSPCTSSGRCSPGGDRGLLSEDRPPVIPGESASSSPDAWVGWRRVVFFGGSTTMNRREVIAAGAAAAAAAGLAAVAAGQEKNAPVKARDPLKVTKLETFLVQPRWLFLKVHTNAGIVGLGEPVVEGRAETVATAVKEIEPYLVGKDPRQVAHHWQAIYR